MEELHPDVETLIARGYERIGHELEPHPRNDEFERARIIARKWRHLVGEARFDIPKCLHRYVNWLMPPFWADTPKPHKITVHNFKLEVPGFATIYIVYKQLGQSAEWYFHQFEILESSTPISSNRYYDLPLFLAIAREFKRPKKKKVIIEEIEGGLADNAKTVKLKEDKPLLQLGYAGNIKNYVLTEADFLNNPGHDVADDDGMANPPIYA